MLTNAYGELTEFLVDYGKVTSDIKWASIGARAINVNGVLLRLEGTFYYTADHVGCLNPKLVLVGEGVWITRGKGTISSECWVFHSHPIQPKFETDDYHMWMGSPWSDSEKEGIKENEKRQKV